MTSHTREKVVREAVIWIQYFVISSLSSVWAHDYYLTALYGLPNEGIEAYHLAGMQRDLWYGYFVPWLVAFLSLCALRFLILVISSRFRKREGADLSLENPR
jgi:hypothetical protein